MSPTEIVAWAKQQDQAGKTDAFGYPLTSWLLARMNHDGSAMRDEHGDQLFETHSEFQARQQQPTTTAIGQTMILF